MGVSYDPGPGLFCAGLVIKPFFTYASTEGCYFTNWTTSPAFFRRLLKLTAFSLLVKSLLAGGEQAMNFLPKQGPSSEQAGTVETKDSFAPKNEIWKKLNILYYFLSTFITLTFI